MDARAITALSALVAVEHAAVYGAASAGGALAPLGVDARDARGLAAAAYTAHRQLRDALIALLLDAGAKPPASQPAYTLPVNPASAGAALTLLAELDDRTAASAYDAIGSATGRARELVVDALAQAAGRAQRARLTAGLAPATAVKALPGRS
ncbi:protein kinase [Pseudofrankia sp. EUN1h]|nr:protein kinase [Pseudofrankia sp. EUN1h]